MSRRSAIPQDDFVFSQDVEIPSARNPDENYTIPRGIWPVMWVELVTKAGNEAGSECVVTHPDGRRFAILRTELIKACEAGYAKKK